jgi:hypothetical protein
VLPLQLLLQAQTPQPCLQLQQAQEQQPLQGLSWLLLLQPCLPGRPLQRRLALQQLLAWQVESLL